ncbi:MAG: hypothetical protein DSM106950_33370 [Stigonema ocellatum SAG 48.90 = DSM 106950]|nr:hypothetical protein [Stigonema ocellatum SAG 48.90 = DSM 106950]
MGSGGVGEWGSGGMGSGGMGEWGMGLFFVDCWWLFGKTTVNNQQSTTNSQQPTIPSPNFKMLAYDLV